MRALRSGLTARAAANRRWASSQSWAAAARRAKHSCGSSYVGSRRSAAMAAGAGLGELPALAFAGAGQVAEDQLAGDGLGAGRAGGGLASATAHSWLLLR
jgi:hypothetical protein